MSHIKISVRQVHEILRNFSAAMDLELNKVKEELIEREMKPDWYKQTKTKEEAIKTITQGGTVKPWMNSEKFIMEYEQKFIKELRALLKFNPDEVYLDGEAANALKDFA